jgi:hypothetical protein
MLSGCESNTDGYTGIEGTGDRVELASAYGTVSGFGSVYVNGVRFDTSAAEVEIAGEPADEADLAVGMVVEVVGEINRDGKAGTAQTIRADRVLRGVIESVDAIGSGRKALRVLGQAVYVNEEATFVGTTFDELAPELGINVSGFVTDNGLITATYIAREDIDVAVDEMEVEGYISAVDEAAESFTLMTLTVHIVGAEFSGGTVQDLVAGKRVRVVGTLAENEKNLQATRIELVTKTIENGRSVSMEGVVRNLIAGDQFKLQGITVDLRNADIEKGTISDITTGVQVIAFGPLLNGVLQAERIRIKPLNTQRFRGAVTDINQTDKSFVLLDTAFQVTKFTQFRDESRSMERYFNFDSLRSGEELEIFAVNVADIWEVTRITRKDVGVGPQNVLRGMASNVNDDRSFYIGAIFIDATEVSEHEWMAVRSRSDNTFEVDVEGSYVDESRFRATHVHIRPRPPCDPHIMFECGPRPTPRAHPR